MSDDSNLDIIETRQYVFNKIQTITTLVEQYLGTTIGLIKCHLEQMKTSTSTDITT